MKKVFWIFFSFLFLLNAGAGLVLFVPGWKDKAMAFVPARTQKILSVVHGDLMHDGSSIKVVKLKTLQGITLEFYSEVQNGARYLITRVEIPNARDGFFDHRGQAVQLAVVDLDGDGKMELLSPTFNQNLLAGLNPYHYSAKHKAFIPFFFSSEEN